MKSKTNEQALEYTKITNDFILQKKLNEYWSILIDSVVTGKIKV